MPEMRPIHDVFQPGADPYWTRLAVGCAWLQEDTGILRFVVGPDPIGRHSDAELSDYRMFDRDQWPWRPPLRLTVRARASHSDGALAGTAGFGFWNTPFGSSNEAMDAPQAVWFFYSSPQSYLALETGAHGVGWRVQVLNSPKINRELVAIGDAGLRIPMLRPILLAAARAVVSEGEAIVHVSLTEWHTYRFDWLTSEVHFFVDGEPIYTAQTSPRGPLGFVAWFDNSQVDVETDPPTFGRLVFSERQWFELGEVTVEPLQALG